MYFARLLQDYQYAFYSPQLYRERHLVIQTSPTDFKNIFWTLFDVSNSFTKIYFFFSKISCFTRFYSSFNNRIVWQQILLMIGHFSFVYVKLLFPCYVPGSGIPFNYLSDVFFVYIRVAGPIITFERNSSPEKHHMM